MGIAPGMELHVGLSIVLACAVCQVTASLHCADFVSSKLSPISIVDGLLVLSHS